MPGNNFVVRQHMRIEPACNYSVPDTVDRPGRGQVPAVTNVEDVRFSHAVGCFSALRGSSGAGPLPHLVHYHLRCIGFGLETEKEIKSVAATPATGCASNDACFHWKREARFCFRSFLGK